MTQIPPFVTPPTSAAAVMFVPSKTSVMAIISLVLGILGFCSGGLLGMVGVVLGIVALVGINKSAGHLAGSGLAIAGICVGACSLLSCPFYAGLMLPALGKARQNAQALKAKSQISAVGLAAIAYADDHSGQFPPVEGWQAELEKSPYVTANTSVAELCIWPGREDEGCAFAMNARLAGLKQKSMESASRPVVLFFEVASRSPMSGGPELLPPRPRSGRAGVVMVFTDGHTEIVRPENLASVPWEP